MTNNVQDRVIAIIAEQALLDTADISPDSSLDDLGIDSLGMVEAIFAIEEEFDVHVPFNANVPGANEFDVSTVAAVVTAVDGLVAEKNQ